MIHTVKEEIYISIYLIAFGIYLISTYDILLYMLDNAKLKNIFKVIIETIYCIIQLIITYFFSYKLASGYIPIYFILFLIIGFVLYMYCLKKSLHKTLDIYKQNVRPHLLKLVVDVLIPTTLIKKIIDIIKKIVKRIKFQITKQKLKKALKKEINNHNM